MTRSFVFVVCGVKEHIDTLHFSLKALRKYSDLPILVVTDLSRNEVEIDHPTESIINVKVNENYNHHEASIYLKTGLHEFLPMEGYLYCYLDTDVVALNGDVAKVFNHYSSPITFATDHCKMNSFSPYAVHCSCGKLIEKLEKLQEWDSLRKALPFEVAKHEWFDKLLQNKVGLKKKSAELSLLTNPSLPFYKLVFNYVFRVLPRYRRAFRIKQWKDLHGTLLVDEGPDYHQFMNDRGFYFDHDLNDWFDSNRNRVAKMTPTFADLCTSLKLKLGWEIACDHLQNAIKKDFGVDVKQNIWRHWNGGMFLFDKASAPFLDTWHGLTMTAFSLPNWKTRDQGTLIATAWKFGLENHSILPAEFNFIADYYSPVLVYEGNLAFRLTDSGPAVSPSFIHIFHHWGDENWQVWRDVYSHICSE